MRALAPGVLVHAANSAAALRVPEARFDMVRCGIAVYGMDPFHRDPAAHGLEPALSLHCYVAEVKPMRAAARAPATAGASSRGSRRGSGRCRSATATACAAR